jgi:hypothetical protein
MNIPVCVRDGCETGTIQIGEFKFEIDLSELNDILVAANLELRESLLMNAAMLQNALQCMEEATFLTMRDSAKPTKSENAKNLKRWHETGCGGYQDLDEAWEAIQKDKETQEAIQAAKEVALVRAWAIRKEEAWEAFKKEMS